MATTTDAMLYALDVIEGRRDVGCVEHDACEGGPCKNPYKGCDCSTCTCWLSTTSQYDQEENS